MESIEKEEPLTRKALEKHIIKVIVTAIILAVIGGVTTSFSMYYFNSNKMNNIIENDSTQDLNIKEMNGTLEEINKKLGTTSTITAVSDERIDGVDQSVKDVKEELNIVKKNQTDILKILGEIKRNQ